MCSLSAGIVERIVSGDVCVLVPLPLCPPIIQRRAVMCVCESGMIANRIEPGSCAPSAGIVERSVLLWMDIRAWVALSDRGSVCIYVHLGTYTCT